MRLAVRFTLLLAGIFVIALAALVWQQEGRLRTRYEEMRTGQLAALFTALDEGTTLAWRSDGQAGINRYLDDLARKQDYFAVRLVRLDALDRDELFKHLPAAEATRVRAGERVTYVDQRSQPRVIVAFAPLAAGALAHAPLAVEMSRVLTGEAGFVHTSLYSFLATTGTTVFVVLVVGAILGARFISDPLARIVLNMRRVGTGDFAVAFHDVEMLSSAEMALLTRELDAMVRQFGELRRRAESEAEARIFAAERARHAERLAAVGTLAAGLAHELGTPLHVASGRAKRLAALPGASDQVRAEAESIRAQCERMRKLVEQLLTLARKPSGPPHSVSLGEVAGRVGEWLEPLARKKDAKLEVVASDNVRCRAHVGLVEQALTNVALNAIQAVGDGGTVRVSMREETRTNDAQQPQRWAVLEVSDDGSGIAPEIRDKIFEPFFTTKSIGKGTGLGLAIAHEIVQEHGGFIDVESHTSVDPGVGGGHGTTMRLFFQAEAT